MTTVVYKDGVMAADTQSTKGSHKLMGMQKVFHVGDWLVGFAGDCCDIPVLLDWLDVQWVKHSTPKWRTPEDFPEDIDTDVLIATPDGKLFEVEHKGRIVPIAAPYHAIGSGSKYAIGALLYGASAAKAVEIAMECDVYSGGAVVATKHKPNLEIVK